MQFSVKTQLSLYLIVLFFLNSIQSSLFELSYDEAYYWIYSKFLSWGYYDHPPMVAWLIKLGSFFGHSEFAVRLPFNILGVLSLYFMWCISNKKNLLLFIFLTLSLPLIQASGFLALPDTALLFFSVLFLYWVKDYLKNESPKNILALSIVTPLLFYSKYHGLAVVLITVFSNPSFIKRKSFWLIVFLTIMLYLPHMYWQYKHDFISFRFHLNGRGQKIFSFANIFNYLLSQMAVFGIFNFFIMILMIKKTDFKNSWERILFFNVFGLLTMLLLVSFRNQIEANWTVTACMASVPLLMILVQNKPKFKKYLYASSALTIVVIMVLRITLMLPYSFYEHKNIARLNEVKGWEKRIEFIVESTKGHTVISDTYQIASKLAFYRNKIVPALHLNSRDSHFSLLKNLIKKIDKDEIIYFLTPKPIKGALHVETGYKDSIYLHKTTLTDLALKHSKKYEEFLIFQPSF